jgi:hypothetical protein
VTLWLDNQLPPALAHWMRAMLHVEAVPIRNLNLQRASVRFEAHENTPTTFHVVIPAPALSGELSDRDLERVAGGFALPSCDQVGAAGVLGMIVGGEVVGGSIHSVTNVNETQAAIGAGVAVAGFAMVVGSIVASHS